MEKTQFLFSISVKAKKRKKIFTDWLVLKKTDCFWTKVLVFGSSICLNPPLRTVTEVGKQVLPLGKEAPGQVHPAVELLNVPRQPELGHDDPLPLPPEILDGVLVRTLTNPVEHRDVLLGQPSLGLPGGVAGGSVLHEDLSPGLVESRSESLLHDVNIYSEHKTFITINSIKIN